MERAVKVSGATTATDTLPKPFSRANVFNAGPMLFTLAVATAAFLFYRVQLLNHDSSWYLVATRKWLGGALLYRDVMEINPPLAFFLTVPGLWLADALAIGDAAGFTLYVVIIGAGTLLAVDALIYRVPQLSVVARHVILGATALVVFVLPVADFGQREHLMVLLAMPYFILLVFAPTGLRCGVVATLLIGLAAALGFALKPYFLAAPLLLGLFSVWQRRSLKPLFHLANWVIGVFCLSYVAVIWLAFPLYLTTILPLGVLVYSAIGTGAVSSLLQPILLITPLVIPLTIYATARGAWRAVIWRWVGLAVGFAAAYLIQGKGWGYHLLPLASILLMALASAAVSKAISWRTITLPAAMGVAFVALLSTLPGPYRNPYVDVFAPVMAQQMGEPALLMLSARVSAGFPLTNISNARWVSRYPTQWAVPGAVRLLADPSCQAPNSCAEIRNALDGVRANTVADILAMPPDIVIAEVQPRKVYFADVSFDYLDWLRQDPAFVEAFANYQLEATIAGHEIWLRKLQ